MVQIDDGVLSALLYVENYKHGVRSMEAIIDMSRLVDKKKWDQSCLPSRKQLDLHDSEEFMKKLLFKVNGTEFIERIAQAIFFDKKESNENVNSNQKNESLNWDRLHENEKVKLRHQAATILDDFFDLKEYGIYYNFDTGEILPNNINELSDEEIEKLAVTLHKRQIEKMSQNGWIYETEENKERKISPVLIIWEHLLVQYREDYIRQVRKIFELVWLAKMYIYKKDDLAQVHNELRHSGS